MNDPAPGSARRAPRVPTLACALAAAALAAGSAGCTSIPRRDLSWMEQYPPRPALPAGGAGPIASEYQVFADRAFAQSTADRPVHFAQLLSVGDDALLARLHLVRAARVSVDVQTFIWKDDAVTRVFFDELLKAADRGVRVRLLVDALFPMARPRQVARMAEAHERIELCIYNPFSNETRVRPFGWIETLFLRMRHVNRRMHNKTFIVDGRIAIVGGRNYEGKYYDRHPEFLFKDREVAVLGPVVSEIAASFEEFWSHRRSVFALQFDDVRAEYANVANRPRAPLGADDCAAIGDLLTLADAPAPSQARPRMAIVPVEGVSFIADAPPRRTRTADFQRTMTREYRALTRSAGERLVYQTPYLIYDRRQRNDIEVAREANPSLRVIVSSNSLAAADHIHVYAISFKHRRLLLRKLGLEIYEFRPVPGDVLDFVPGYRALGRIASADSSGDAASAAAPLPGGGPRLCLHAKTLVVDGRIALVGSHNFDPRSSDLNAECGLIFHDAAFAARIEAEILRDIAPRNSWVVARRPLPEGFAARWSERLSNFSSRLPFLDAWPQIYSSLFEPIREGVVLRPRDAAFYELYRDVGSFPEVTDPAVLRRLRLIKNIGGWARPLL